MPVLPGRLVLKFRSNQQNGLPANLACTVRKHHEITKIRLLREIESENRLKLIDL